MAAAAGQKKGRNATRGRGGRRGFLTSLHLPLLPAGAARPPTGRPLRVSALFLLYAALHSALASSAAKRGFAKLAGQRARNGLYRPLYVAQALLSTLAAAAAFGRLPDRDLYQLP